MNRLAAAILLTVMGAAAVGTAAAQGRPPGGPPQGRPPGMGPPPAPVPPPGRWHRPGWGGYYGPGGGWHRPGWHRPGWYRPGWYGRWVGPSVGFYWSGPLTWSWPVYPYPVYTQPPVIVVPGSVEYVERPQAPPPQTYWYYCTEPAGYFPYVQNCGKPWIPVRPQDVQPPQPAQ